MKAFFSKDNDSLPPLHIPPISVLSPDPTAPLPDANLDSQWAEDLGLDELVSALVTDRSQRPFVSRLLATLTTDVEVIRWRQAVLADFVNNPALTEAVEIICPRLHNLGSQQPVLGQRTRSSLLETTDRLSELDLYIELVLALHEALSVANLQSQALITLRDALADLIDKPDFKRLQAELPELREPLQNIGSLTVAINLDVNLKPLSAVLVAINPREVGPPPSLFDRLVGAAVGEDTTTPQAGIAPVHRFPEDRKQRRYDEFFQDIDKLMQQTAKPIAQALTRYVRTSSATLVSLEPGLAFFAAAVRLIQRIEAAGLPVCQPAAAPLDERRTDITALANIQLVLKGTNAVGNDVRFDETGRVAILTGPNSGGKTTYLRAVGLAQVMFQAGLFLPAQAATLSPVDRVLTHFPRLETRQQGRLAEEAGRLRQIFAQASGHSLILLNETFSSTAFGEAIYLAQDILSGLCTVGVRAIFATHLVELVDNIAEIEGAVDAQSRLYSLVAGIRTDDEGGAVPTFRITRREPLGRSYAREIARRHGISLEQILEARNGDGTT